jgi:hypothetical protein
VLDDLQHLGALGWIGGDFDQHEFLGHGVDVGVFGA